MDARLKEGFSPSLMKEFIAGDSKIYRLYNMCAARGILRDTRNLNNGIIQYQVLNLN